MADTKKPKSPNVDPNDLFGDVFNQMASGGQELNGVMQSFSGLASGMNALQSAMSGLVNIIGEFKSAIGNIRQNVGNNGNQSGGSSAQAREAGWLFRQPLQEQQRVLSDLASKQGKIYQNDRGSMVPTGATEYARQNNINLNDVKKLINLANQEVAGYQGYGKAFGRQRGANFSSLEDYYNADISRTPRGNYGGNQGLGVRNPQAQAQAGGATSFNVNTNAPVNLRTPTTIIQPTPGANLVTNQAPQNAPRIPYNPPQQPQQPQQRTGGGGNQGGGGGNQGGGMGGFIHGNMGLGSFLQMASPFSPMSMAWMMMSGMSGQLYPAFQALVEPSMAGGEWSKQGIRGVTDFGASFSGLPALGKLFNKVAGTDAFELYESMYSSFTVLKNVYRSQEKAGSTIQESINLARETPLEVNDLLKVFSTFSVNPQLRGVLSNKEQMGQLATGVAGLSFLVPEQGTGGAIFAMREALAGQYRSMRMRFNLDPTLIASAGGMSMDEMKQKPTNFLGALDSFLKQNLGQQTFNDLQMTFSKQVGNIFDSITGGIFKSFRQTGMYEGVTQFANEASNLTQKVFASDQFGRFFGDFGNKVVTQFSKASSAWGSIDFNLDSNEEIKKKFITGIGHITKDLVTSVSPNIDKVIDIASPAAKQVGTMVSSFLSKGMADIFSNMFSIGMNGIISTIESPVREGLKKALPASANEKMESLYGAQTDLITEHPFLIFAGGALASAKATKFAWNTMGYKSPTGGLGGVTGYIKDIWQGNGIVGGALDKLGIGGAPGTLGNIAPLALSGLLAYNAYSKYQQAMGVDMISPEQKEAEKFARWQRGDTKLMEYYSGAVNAGFNGYPYKKESDFYGASLGGLNAGIAMYRNFSALGPQRQAMAAMAPPGFIGPTRMIRMTPGTSIGNLLGNKTAAGLLTGAAAIGLNYGIDRALGDFPLTAEEDQNIKFAGSIGGGMSAAGGALMLAPNMYAKGAGAALMGLGTFAETGTKAYYRMFGSGDSASTKFQSAQGKRIDAANKTITEAIDTVLSGSIGDIKSLDKIGSLEEVAGHSWGQEIEKMSGSLVSSKQIKNTESAKNINNQLSIAAQKVVNGELKLTKDNFLEWMKNNTSIPPEELKDLSEMAARELVTANVANKMNENNPGLQASTKLAKDRIIAEMAKSSTIVGNLPQNAQTNPALFRQADNATNKIQEWFGQQEVNFSKTKDALINAMSTEMQGKGYSKQVSDMFATNQAEKMGFGLVNKPLNDLKQLGMTKEAYLSDKVYNRKQSAEGIFNPDWISNPQETQKAYEQYLQTTYKKSLLFGTKNESLGVGTYVMDELATAFPQNTPDNIMGSVLKRRNDEAMKGLKGEIAAFQGSEGTLQGFMDTMGNVDFQVTSFKATGVNSKMGQKVKQQTDAIYNGFISDYVSVFKEVSQEDYQNKVDVKKQDSRQLWRGLEGAMGGGIPGAIFGLAGDAAGAYAKEKIGYKTEEEAAAKKYPDLMSAQTTELFQMAADSMKEIRSSTGLPKDVDAGLRKALQNITANPSGSTDVESLKDRLIKGEGVDSRVVDRLEKSGKLGEYASALRSLDVNKQILSGTEKLQTTQKWRTPDEMMETIRSQYMGERGIGITAQGKEAIQSYNAMMDFGIGSLSNNLGGLTSMMSGGYARGMAQPYQMINGRMIQSSFNLEGQEFPNIFAQAQIQEIREKNALSGPQIQRVNAEMKPASDKLSKFYGAYLDEAMMQQERDGMAPPRAMKDIEAIRAMMGQAGVMPDSETQTKEMVFRARQLRGALGSFEENGMAATMQDQGALVAQLAAATGYTGQEAFKEKSPMEETAGLSGIGESLTAMTAAASNAASALTGFTENATAAATALAAIGGGGIPNSSKLIEPPTE